MRKLSKNGIITDLSSEDLSEEDKSGWLVDLPEARIRYTSEDQEENLKEEKRRRLDQLDAGLISQLSFISTFIVFSVKLHQGHKCDVNNMMIYYDRYKITTVEHKTNS